MREARLERVVEEETDSFENRGVPEFLSDPIGILRRRWRWMLLALAVGAVATVLLVVLMKPRYLAASTVLVTSQEISEDFVRSTLPANSLERINALVGKILSRETLVEIIEEYDLYPELRETLSMGEIAIKMREAISIVAGSTTERRPLPDRVRSRPTRRSRRRGQRPCTALHGREHPQTQRPGAIDHRISASRTPTGRDGAPRADRKDHRVQGRGTR